MVITKLPRVLTNMTILKRVLAMITKLPRVLTKITTLSEGLRYDPL